MEQEWRKDEEGKFICRYNEACHCDLPTCGCCGWNPKVARNRLREHIRNTAREEEEHGAELCAE